MGQYKVPQDVEADDKIIGNLTLKQFMYTVIAAIWGLVTFAVFRKLPLLFVIIGLPPTLLFGLLGLYKRQDQPFEAFFLALLSFMAKPRQRLWQKEPILEAFKIEAPPPPPHEIRRDPSEVRSQLDQLAKIVDTRGWAAKQPELQEPDEAPVVDLSDRIGQPVMSPEPEPSPQDVELKDDILDFKNNPSAQNLNVLIENSVKHIREEAMERMKTAEKSQPAAAKPAAKQASTSEMTSNPLTGILKVAMENEDLTVSQIAAQAQRQVPMTEGQPVSVKDATTNPQ